MAIGALALGAAAAGAAAANASRQQTVMQQLAPSGWNPPQRLQTNCTSYRLGNAVNTNCN
jgi:hypothetical protein